MKVYMIVTGFITNPCDRFNMMLINKILNKDPKIRNPYTSRQIKKNIFLIVLRYSFFFSIFHK